MLLSIIIPCYNEEKNIPLIFERISETVEDRKDIEIILVDNGSTDNSKMVFEAELQKMNSSLFNVLTIENNQGYGHGILEGLKKANGETLAWTHADMQTDPNDVLIAYDLFLKNNENVFIKGKRRKRKLLESLFTFGMQLVALFALKTYIDDINAQPKLFSKDFYSKHINTGAPIDFSLDLFALFMAKKNGIDVLQIPVYFGKRMHGEAKGGGSWKTRIKLIKRTFSYIFELKKLL